MLDNHTHLALADFCENSFVVLLMVTPFSQEMEPPANSARFRLSAYRSALYSSGSGDRPVALTFAAGHNDPSRKRRLEACRGGERLH